MIVSLTLSTVLNGLQRLDQHSHLMSSLENGYLTQLVRFLDAPYDAILTEEQLNERGIPPSRHAAFQDQHFLHSFGVRSWYDILTTANTFETVLVPISFQEGQVLTVARFNDAELEPEKVATLSALESRIHSVLTDSLPNGAFVKLETRSPKDIPWSRIRPKLDTPERDRFMPMLDQELLRLLRSGDEWSLNNLMNSFSIAASRFLSVKTGVETMALLLKSVRIYEDLKGAVAIGEDLWDTSLVFRAWDDRVPDLQAYEFRGFVFNRQLTALTQYNDWLYFPALVARRAEIERQIRTYFDTISGVLPHQHYLIDFIVFSRTEIKVIELNPLTTCAGSGLFHWINDIERIKNGPFEMRVRTEPDPALVGFVDDHWIQYFNEFMETHKETSWGCCVM
jgi:hypothetical protein